MSKYLSVPATLPWRLDGNNYAIIKADVDGDARQEIVVFDRDNYSLGILSYFLYSELSTVWKDDAWGKVVTISLCQRNVPPYDSNNPNNLPTFGLLGNAQFYVGDIDGDQHDEIVVFQPNDVNTGTNHLVVLKWNGSELGWRSSQPSELPSFDPKTSLTFGLLSNAQFYVADVDGDGQDEIIVFQPNDTNTGTNHLVVLKWNGAGFGWVSSQDGDINHFEPNIKMPATLSGNAQFYVGDVDGDQHDEIVVFQPTYTNMAVACLLVLKWKDSGFGWTSFVVKDVDAYAPNNPVQFGLLADAQLYVGDIDGDKRDEIVVFQPNDVNTGGVNHLVVLKWNSSGLGWWSSQPFDIPSFDPKTSTVFGLLSNARSYVADVDGDGREEIVIFQPNDVNTGGVNHLVVLKWNVSELGWWSSQPSDLPSFDPKTSLTFGLLADAQFYVGDIDGDGLDEIIVFQPNDVNTGGVNHLVVLKWNGSMLGWSASMGISVPGWSLDLILAPPPTSFTPFVGNQLDIYKYMSNFTNLDAARDIRSQYTNFNIYGTDFSALATQISNIKSPPAEYSQADWDAVKNVLVPELQAVDTVCAVFDNLADLCKKISVKQDADLLNDLGNLTLVAAHVDKVSYWTSQIFDAVLWGASVVPEAKGAQVGLALTASLFGSFLSSQGGDQPKQVDYANVKATLIDNTYLAVSAQNGITQMKVLGDPTMLGIISLLAKTTWAWTPSTADQITQSSQNANRIMFYQILIPAMLKILVWSDVTEDYPFHYVPPTRFEDAKIERIPAPSHAYWSEKQPTGKKYNVHLLYSGSDHTSHYSDFKYPSSDLTDDLFSNLNVNKEEFFKGQQGWQVIKRVYTSEK